MLHQEQDKTIEESSIEAWITSIYDNMKDANILRPEQYYCRFALALNDPEQGPRVVQSLVKALQVLDIETSQQEKQQKIVDVFPILSLTLQCAAADNNAYKGKTIASFVQDARKQLHQQLKDVVTKEGTSLSFKKVLLDECYTKLLETQSNLMQDLVGTFRNTIEKCNIEQPNIACALDLIIQSNHVAVQYFLSNYSLAPEAAQAAALSEKTTEVANNKEAIVASITVEAIHHAPVTAAEKSKVQAALATINLQTKKELSEELRGRGFVTRTIDFLVEAIAKILKFFTGKEIDLGQPAVNAKLSEIRMRSHDQKITEGMKL